MVIPADLFPQKLVASVAGLVGFGGALGGVVFGEVVGRSLDSGLGYGFVFGIVSTLHIAAFLLILITVRAVRPLHRFERQVQTHENH
jgi:ACS family hexuronate transporter-like MFS transporter